jgi:hypothetical protein
MFSIYNRFALAYSSITTAPTSAAPTAPSALDTPFVAAPLIVISVDDDALPVLLETTLFTLPAAGPTNEVVAKLPDEVGSFEAAEVR